MILRIWRIFLGPVAALISGIFVAGCASTSSDSRSKQELTTVSHVNLPRYMGDWHVIATIPNSIERHAVGSVESYKLRDDGKIANTFTYYKKSFDNPLKRLKATAWVVNQKTNAEWRVQFIWPFTAKYLVIDLDPDYQWTVVGHPSRQYGWVMARNTHLSAHTYQGILSRLENQGYDSSKFVKVPQNPSEIPREKR